MTLSCQTPLQVMVCSYSHSVIIIIEVGKDCMPKIEWMAKCVNRCGVYIISPLAQGKLVAMVPVSLWVMAMDMLQKQVKRMGMGASRFVCSSR